MLIIVTETFLLYKAFNTKLALKKMMYAKNDRRSVLYEYYADPTFAKTLLNWIPERNLDDMTRDLWRWELFKHKDFL